MNILTKFSSFSTEVVLKCLSLGNKSILLPAEEICLTDQLGAGEVVEKKVIFSFSFMRVKTLKMHLNHTGHI